MYETDDLEPGANEVERSPQTKKKYEEVFSSGFSFGRNGVFANTLTISSVSLLGNRCLMTASRDTVVGGPLASKGGMIQRGRRKGKFFAPPPCVSCEKLLTIAGFLLKNFWKANLAVWATHPAFLLPCICIHIQYTTNFERPSAQFDDQKFRRLLPINSKYL